jgi:hypothetical protein
MTKFQKIVTTWTITTGLLGGLVLASAIFTYPLFSVNAQSVKAQSVSSTTKLSISGKPFSSLNFSDTGRPRRRSGGASRVLCMASSKLPLTDSSKPVLTALVPEMSAGLTLSQSPTFWFYLPYTLSSNQFVEFVLKDDQDRYVYKTKLSGAEVSAGIIRLPLPSTIALTTNSNYHWYFVVHCEPQNQDRFVYANGLIRRVERPQLAQQLKVAPVQEHTRLYTDEGIWYDALTSLGDRLRLSPQDDSLKQDWTSLLEAVGLEKLASEPFASCCSSTTTSQQTQPISPKNLHVNQTN